MSSHNHSRFGLNPLPGEIDPAQKLTTPLTATLPALEDDTEVYSPRFARPEAVIMPQTPPNQPAQPVTGQAFCQFCGGCVSPDAVLCIFMRAANQGPARPSDGGRSEAGRQACISSGVCPDDNSHAGDPIGRLHLRHHRPVAARQTGPGWRPTGPVNHLWCNLLCLFLDPTPLRCHSKPGGCHAIKINIIHPRCVFAALSQCLQDPPKDMAGVDHSFYDAAVAWGRQRGRVPLC